jgi:hypothetical protein
VDDLDRLLSREPRLVPSPGFAAAVMDAVRTEATLPSALRFPWRRFVAGFGLSAILLVAGLATLPSVPAESLSPDALLPMLEGGLRYGIESGLLWAILGVGLSCGWAYYVLRPRAPRTLGI